MGSLTAVDRAGRKTGEASSDPAPKPDAIDEAIARFRTPRALDELIKGGPVFTSWDQLDMPDLTDEERKAFAAALDE